MYKLVVSLGYDLRSDNSIHTILENRLKNAVDFCSKYKDSDLLLMGASSYRKAGEGLVSQASVMRDYLLKNFARELEGVKIMTEETTTSTVEQLCYLKKFIEKEKLKYSDLVIVSSKFFGDRVKIYSEYIFGNTSGIIFVESEVPPEMVERFQKVEAQKFKEIQSWLKDHKKGDDQNILKEQKEFQGRVLKGETKQPIS